MKNIICIFILLLFCMCNKKVQNNDNLIYGEIKNAPKNISIKFFERNGNNFDIIDSAFVFDSIFRFQLKKSKLKFYAIEVDNKDFLIHFMADSGQNINFKFDYNNLREYKVQNSVHSQIIANCQNKLDSCNKIIVENIKNNKPYIDAIEKYRSEMLQFSKLIDTSPAVIVLLSQKFIDGQVVFPIEHYYELYKNILQNLYKKYSSYDFYMILKNFVKKYENEIQKNNQIQKIEKVYSFKSRTIDGKTFMFENYLNKYVLLCFWASWQFESYKTNIFLKNIEENYKQLNIVQLALDTDKKIVEDSLKKFNFKHTIIVEPMVWQSDIVKAYKVQQLPTYLLIFKNEIIIKTVDKDLIYKNIKEIFDK